MKKLIFIILSLLIFSQCSTPQKIKYENGKYFIASCDHYVMYSDFGFLFYENKLVHDLYGLVGYTFRNSNNKVIFYNNYPNMTTTGDVFFVWKLEHNILYIGIQFTNKNKNTHYMEWYTFDALKDMIQKGFPKQRIPE
jgi:hypothetical protein